MQDQPRPSFPFPGMELDGAGGSVPGWGGHGLGQWVTVGGVRTAAGPKGWRGTLQLPAPQGWWWGGGIGRDRAWHEHVCTGPSHVCSVGWLWVPLGGMCTHHVCTVGALGMGVSVPGRGAQLQGAHMWQCMCHLHASLAWDPQCWQGLPSYPRSIQWLGLAPGAPGPAAPARVPGPWQWLWQWHGDATRGQGRPCNTQPLGPGATALSPLAPPQALGGSVTWPGVRGQSLLQSEAEPRSLGFSPAPSSSTLLAAPSLQGARVYPPRLPLGLQHLRQGPDTCPQDPGTCPRGSGTSPPPMAVAPPLFICG